MKTMNFTQEQKDYLLCNIQDAYKINNAERGIIGYDDRGNEIIGFFPYQYDKMVKSTVTGHNIRYFCEFEDDVFHPSEVFNISEKDVVSFVNAESIKKRSAMAFFYAYVEKMSISDKEMAKIAINKVRNNIRHEIDSNNPYSKISYLEFDLMGNIVKKSFDWYVRNSNPNSAYMGYTIDDENAKQVGNWSSTFRAVDLDMLYNYLNEN